MKFIAIFYWKHLNCIYSFRVMRIMDFNRTEPTCYSTTFPYNSNATFSYIVLHVHLTYIWDLIFELSRNFPIDYLALLSGLHCQRTWDNIMCWPDTPAGSTIYQPCPSYIHGFDTEGIVEMSRDMWFPTMWHFDKCRLRRAWPASFKA